MVSWYELGRIAVAAVPIDPPRSRERHTPGLRVRGTCREELDGITRKLLPSADPSAQYHKPHLSPNQHSKTIAVTVRLDVESYWYLVSHDGKPLEMEQRSKCGFVDVGVA